MTTALEVRVGALVNGLSACLCAELEVAEDESGVKMPCICTTLPGSAVPFDYCAEGGMAWARLVGIEPVPTVGRCAVEYDVTVEVAILRCAPGIDEAGNLPSDEEQQAAAMLQFFDMGVLHKVLTCCTVPTSFSFQTIGSYAPVLDGGCLGGFWTATWRMT